MQRKDLSWSYQLDCLNIYSVNNFYLLDILEFYLFCLYPGLYYVQRGAPAKPVLRVGDSNIYGVEFTLKHN